MEKLQSYDVFKPGAFPEYTYISRLSSDLNLSYEFRLKQALRTAGFLTSIIGPSKTGKTVLCEKVIGIDNIISLSGSDFKNHTNFWEVVACKVGLSLEGEFEKIRSQKESVDSENSYIRSTTSREVYRSGKDNVIDFFKDNKLVLVLDDFHYASEELQFNIAYQLKDAIRRGFKAIIISLPHRADDAIRKNPDLSGRLNQIDIESWKKEELEKIAITGFEKLGINISKSFAEEISVESLTSPQLMQSICLNISLLSDIDDGNELDTTLIEKSYKSITINLPYEEVANKLKAGPSTRGQKRKTYKINEKEEFDVYGMLIKAITLNPPSISITIDELKNRIDKLMKDVEFKIDKSKVRDTLKKIQEIIDSSGPLYQVFEWKDNQIYIIEPLFLFYIRWGVN